MKDEKFRDGTHVQQRADPSARKPTESDMRPAHAEGRGFRLSHVPDRVFLDPVRRANGQRLADRVVADRLRRALRLRRHGSRPLPCHLASTSHHEVNEHGRSLMSGTTHQVTFCCGPNAKEETGDR